MGLVDAPGEALLATAAEQPHDPGFVPFVRRAQAAGIAVEVVSDGFGFFIGPALEALGVGELPVVSALTTFAGRRASIAFPNGHPACLVCGTCKRNRVLAHQAAGRAVVFIGDGESDRYAAGYADVVWAKRRSSGSASRLAGTSAAGPNSARSTPGWRPRWTPGARIRRPWRIPSPGRSSAAPSSGAKA